MLCLASSLIGVTSTAGEEEADAEFQRGVERYEAGSHEEASAAFEHAYALDANPLYLFSWAQAEVAADHCEQAVIVFRRYLDSDPPEANRLAAESRIRTCEERIAAAIPPPVDPSAAAAPAQSAPPTAGPPPTATTTPPASAATNLAPAATAPSTPMAAADPGSGADDPVRWWGDPLTWTLLGAGTLATGAGAGILIWAQSTFAAAREQTFDSYDIHLSALGAARDRRIAGGVSLGLGLALLGGGVVRALLVEGDAAAPRPDASGPIRLLPSPWWTAAGGGLALTAAF